MDSQYPSSLDLELRKIKARNIDRKSSGDLFVRCYLPAGNKKGVIKLDTHQISPKSNLIWDQTYSLNCSSAQGTSLLQQEESNITLELRRRIPAPFLGSSKLVGRAQVTWKECVESRNMKIERWVSMIPKSSGRVHDQDSKPAAVHISVRIQESAIDGGLRRWDIGGCICMDGIGCNSCHLDYEFFALGSSLEALVL